MNVFPATYILFTAPYVLLLGMADTLNDILSAISTFVWGPFLLIPLLLGTGLFLTIRLRGIQFRTLGRATRHAFVDKPEEGAGDISNYQALTTALAATVGTGNIVGVATAISIGGPGALFWIWLTGIVGMASKYSEAYLGVRFRTTDKLGKQQGGPHEYLKTGVGGRFGKTLAAAFTLFTIFASFGIGNLAQGNSIAAGMNDAFGISANVAGVIIFFAVGAAVLGGIEGIGHTRAGLECFQAGLCNFADDRDDDFARLFAGGRAWAHCCRLGHAGSVIGARINAEPDHHADNENDRHCTGLPGADAQSRARVIDGEELFLAGGLGKFAESFADLGCRHGAEAKRRRN